MAATALTVLDASFAGFKLVDAGTDGKVAANVDGNFFAHVDGGMYFIVAENQNVAARTITVNSQTACDQGADHDIAVTLAEDDVILFGPFGGGRFKDGDGYVQITYDAVTDLTIKIMRAAY